MPNSKKIFLIEERRETLRVRNQKEKYGFCEKCGTKTVWLTSAESAEISGFTERNIFRLIESGKLHFAETQAGLIFICNESLKFNSRVKEQEKNEK